MTTTHTLRHGSLALRVWLLAGIAVLAALAIVLVHAQLVSGLSEDRERMAHELQRSRDALGTVRSNMLVVNASLQRLLGRDGGAEEFDVGEVQHQLTRCRTVLEGARLLPRSLRAQLEFGEGLLADVREWSVGDAENQRALDELTHDSSRRFDALRNALVDAGEARDASEERARFVLRVETATLRAAALELRLANDAADVVALRANVIEPCLARMQTAVASIPDAGESARLRDEVTALRGDLVGAAVAGLEGGLHAARMRAIELEGRHARLEASAARVVDAVNAELEQLLQGTQERMVEVTDRTELALVRARLWTNVIGGSVLAIFLGVCWYISRAIQRQVSVLEATTIDLSRANAAHEEASKRASVMTSAMECAADAIVIADASGKITWVNPAFSGMTGFARDAVLGTPAPFAGESGEDGARGENPWPTLRSGVAWRGEVLARRKDGSAYVQQGTVTPVKDEHGAVTCYVGIERDATSEHEAQNALEEAHAEIELVLRSLSAILIGVGLDGRVSTWNRHAESILGQPSVRAHGTLLQDLGLNWDLASVVAGMHRCVEERKEVRLNEVRFARPDGTSGILGVTLSPMFDAKDELRGSLIVARDITSIRSLESQLSRAQKLEAIGQLAAGIAHEINTPTQFISDNTRFVRDSVGELAPLLDALAHVAEAPEASGATEHETLARIVASTKSLDLDFLRQEVPQALDQSLEGLERISTIVLAMKKFSHPGSGRKDAVDLNQSVQNTITVARNEWRYVADVETAFDASLPRPQCFEQEINQVVLNMIVNAAHAIAERAKKEPGHKGLIRVATRSADDQVAIDVTDNGCGIPPGIRDRIFDPFFTTKEVGKGTGQGLAIAHDVVVKKHGGRIEVQSEPGQGTTFTVWLPVEERATAG